MTGDDTAAPLHGGGIRNRESRNYECVYACMRAFYGLKDEEMQMQCDAMGRVRKRKRKLYALQICELSELRCMSNPRT